MFRTIFNMLDQWYNRIMPARWLHMKPRYQWASGIAIVATVWILSGFITGTSNGATESDAHTNANTTPRVQVSVLNATERNATITVRGLTQALHAVDVRAEVEGVVKALHFEKGDYIKKGAVLCEIKLNDRGARLDQARAMVAQTAKQHQVDLELAKEGFRSKTQVSQSAAALEAAKASQRTMSIQVGNTKMRAPFDGYVDDRYVDVGDYMKVGDKCALVIAPEPFLVVGMVTENEVGQITIGDPATAQLATGETVKGKVRFVASRADTVTRSFRVEVELPNADNKLRDGVSADIHIPVRKLKAQKISSGILVLDDSGEVGVRIVKDKIVHFVPVHILSDGPAGMWVSGLPDHVTVITVGQEFVKNGEKVDAVITKDGAAT